MKLDFNDILDYVNGAIAAIEYPAEPANLYAPVAYSLEGNGKRLRPVLTIAACMACGGSPDDARNQALGIEMFHNFTLLHDDVMDNSELRRGRPTVHVKWGEAGAILSGDAMLTMAGMLVSTGCPDDKLREVLAVFNKMAMAVYEGQQMDMDFESRRDVTVEEYLYMIRLKTSVLLACACQAGAIMAGAGAATQSALYDYGVNLGLAFQLQDDYLDTFGNTEEFGKPIGGDIINEKKTWLLISAMVEQKSVVDLFRLPAMEKVREVTAVYNRLGLPGRCRELIDSYCHAAIKALDGAEITNREFFENLVVKAAQRSK